MPLFTDKDIVTLILQGEKLKDPNRWAGSHNGAKLDSVDRVDCGADDQGIWFSFAFTEAGSQHTIRGTFTFSNFGEKITHDGKDCGKGDVTVGEQLAGGLVGIVQFKSGEHLEDVYRFDGKLLTLWDIAGMALAR